MADERVINYTDKNIKEFVPGDTIYFSKIFNGYQVTVLCKFIKYERGVVTAEPIYGSVNPDWGHSYFFDSNKNPIITTAKVTNCFLYGIDKGSGSLYNHCIWFRKGVAQ